MAECSICGERKNWTVKVISKGQNKDRYETSPVYYIVLQIELRILPTLSWIFLERNKYDSNLFICFCSGLWLVNRTLESIKRSNEKKKDNKQTTHKIVLYLHVETESLIFQLNFTVFHSKYLSSPVTELHIFVPGTILPIFR